MAITPEQAYRLRLQNSEEDIQRFEQRCDKALSSNWHGKRSVEISTRDVPALVQEEVTRRFRAVGWTVDKVHDQRDGEYLSFSVFDKGYI